ELGSADRLPDCLEVDTWLVGPRQASLSSLATVTSPTRNLLMMEWMIPPALTALEVTGAEVRSWARTGPRLQVWLQRPCARAEVRIAGWLPLPASARAGEAPTAPGRIFSLPAVNLRVPAARHVVSIAP